MFYPQNFVAKSPVKSSLNLRRLVLIVSLYYKVQNLPEIFCNYFVSCNNEIHHQNTRNASLLHKSYKNKLHETFMTLAKEFEFGTVLRVKDFKQIKSHFIFKREVKKHFLRTN